jgi:hypothetical protein
MMPRLRQLSRAGAFAIGLAIVLGATACGGSDNSATTTTPTVVAGPQTELFEGKLDVRGSAFYSFTVTQTGNATFMLASVTTSTTPGTSTGVVLGLGVGSPLGTGCVQTQTVLAFGALQSPLVSNLTPGIYCVQVSDVGNLTIPVNFAIRIVHT